MSEPAFEWDEGIIPDLTHVVTEDDEPVDNLFSERQQRLLVESLYASAHHLKPFLAMANVGLFFNPNQAPYVPDMLLSLGVQAPEGDVWEKQNRSYFIWIYGKPPEVVVEVVSNKDRHEEEKIQGYARLGIAYYVIYDPAQFLSQRKLRVYELHGASYVPVVDSSKLTSLPLGIKVVPGEFEDLQGNWLRWVDPTGNLLLTGRERAEQECQRADQERERADQERERANQERERADQERQRADRLAARLRELGLDP
jgi:Uma2 family endonuclease